MAKSNMQGKVCLVTGSSSGIGKVAARELAKMGATVVIVCRNRTKGEAAQAEIKAALAGKPNATVYSYPGQRHAFARHNGAHYNAAAAALANGRTAQFLHQQLRS